MATRALRQLTFGQGKSAGRNSAGRITIFHRGGGAKRLQRIIDLKRSTSAMGVVERIEYDPNRSSRIALVRWTQGVEQPTPRRLRTKEAFVPPPELLEPSATTIRGQFSFCSLPGMVDRSSQPSFSTPAKADHVMIGHPAKNPVYTKGPNASATSKLASAKEVFFSAFSSPIAAAKGGSGSFSRLPRMAVAGARPPFFATRMGEGDDEKTKFSLSEIQKWKPESIVWAHRIKRKAALPW